MISLRLAACLITCSVAIAVGSCARSESPMRSEPPLPGKLTRAPAGVACAVVYAAATQTTVGRAGRTTGRT